MERKLKNQDEQSNGGSEYVTRSISIISSESDHSSQKSGRVIIQDLSYSDADSINESEFLTQDVDSRFELISKAEPHTGLPWACQPRGRIYRAPAFHNRTELKKLFRDITQCPDQTPIKMHEPQHPAISPQSQHMSKIARRWKEIENCNIALSQKSIRKGKLVGPDRLLAKYLGVQPRRVRVYQSTTALNLLVNIKNYFYGEPEPRVTKISFPPEIIELAEMHGDRAGRDRAVTPSTYPSRRSRRMKLRKVYDKKRGRTIIDPEIRDISNLDDEDGCLDCIIHNSLTERLCLSNHKKVVGPGDEHWSHRYSQAVYKFGYNLEIATDYVDGMMKSVRGAENYMKFSSDSEEKESLNYVSAQIWLGTFAIQDLFLGTSTGIEGKPTKLEFEGITSRLEQVASDAELLAERAITFAVHFCEFGKEVLNHLSKTGKLLGIKVDTSVSKPIKKYDGLKILKKTKELKQKDAILLKVVARSKIEVKPTWENFSSYPKQFRLDALQGLEENALEAVHRLRNQLRFVYEDVASQKFDDEEPPFMTICILLQDLIRYFVDSEETSKAHLENLTSVMDQFIEQTRVFIARTQEMLVNMVELRDMAYLCIDYMREEYHIDLGDYSPSKAKTSLACGCCRRRKGPHYKEEDFMHTPYREALLRHCVSVETADLFLAPTADENGELKEIRFAKPELGWNDSSIFERNASQLEQSSNMSNFVLHPDPKTSESLRNLDPHVQQPGSPELVSILLPPESSERRRWSLNVPLVNEPELIEPRSVSSKISGPLQPILKTQHAPFQPNPAVEMPKVSIKWSKKRLAKEAQQQLQQQTKLKGSSQGQAEVSGAVSPKQAITATKQGGQAAAPKPKSKSGSPAGQASKTAPTGKQKPVVLKVRRSGTGSMILKVSDTGAGAPSKEKLKTISKQSISELKTSSKNELPRNNSKATAEFPRVTSKAETELPIDSKPAHTEPPGKISKPEAELPIASKLAQTEPPGKTSKAGKKWSNAVEIATKIGQPGKTSQPQGELPNGSKPAQSEPPRKTSPHEVELSNASKPAKTELPVENTETAEKPLPEKENEASEEKKKNDPQAK